MFGIRRVFMIAFLVLLVAPFLLFGYLSIRIFEPKLLHEFETQTIAASSGVQGRIDRAIESFGGMHTLRDVEPVLDSAREAAPGMSFLAVSDTRGNILHLSADNPEAVRRSLAQVALSSPERSGVREGLGGMIERLTGISVSESTTTMSSRSGGDLLVTGFPLGGDQPVGILYAGLDTGALDALKQDIWVDTGVVVFAIVLLAMEMLVLIFAIYLLRPVWAIDFLTARLRDRDLRFTLRSFGGGTAHRLIHRIDKTITRLAASSQSDSGLRLPVSEPRPLRIPAVSHVRLPLFLFFLSEGLLRPVLPQFLATFSPPGTDPNLRIGVIMAGFMAASLFSVLMGSIMSERAGGARKVFFWGSVCAAVGMAGHLIAGDFLSILLMRTFTGFGYGLVFAAAQVHIAQHADPARRTTGFSLFLAVFVAAEICGPAIGGIIADRFGDTQVLQGATLVIVFAAAACVLLLPSKVPDITNPEAEPREEIPDIVQMRPGLSMDVVRGQWAMVAGVLANVRFTVAIFCFTVPAKALLTGGLFLLVPLTVFANGGEAVESARVLMGYGIAILLLVPVLAPLADRWKQFGAWVAVGGIAAGVGFVLPHAWGVFNGAGLWIIFISAMLFGLGQTLSIPTQISFLMQTADHEVHRFGKGTVLGIFRFLERLGSFAGPIIAGLLLLSYPPDLALMWMGLGSILLAAIGLSWFMAVGQRDEEEAINALLVEA